MQRLFLLLSFISIGHWAASQQNAVGLPVNPATGKVAILDSAKVSYEYPPAWVQYLMTDWSDYTASHNPTVRLFGLSPTKNKLIVGFTPFYPENSRFYKECSFFYQALKNNKKDLSNPINGQVSFRLYFLVRKDHVLLEITDFNYMSPHEELGNFEAPQLLSHDGVHYLTESQKPWTRIRKQYYSWARIVMRDVKAYIERNYKTKNSTH